MIVIDNKNFRQDIQRLVWYIVPILLAFLFGYLLSYFFNEPQAINYTTLSNATCPDVYVLPIRTPESGIR